jgi:hypothetical protein
MLSGLWLSVYCFSFTDPGRRELREREKFKKTVDQQGLCDPYQGDYLTGKYNGLGKDSICFELQ